MFDRMSDYLDPRNEELLKDFFEEAQAQVELLEANVLVLENDPGNRDAVDEIFRAAHTLKGGAATVEMQELSQFTHLIEDVLDQIRGGKLRVDGSLVDDLLASIDVVKRMLEGRQAGGVFSEDIGALVASLRGRLGKEQRGESAAAGAQKQQVKNRQVMGAEPSGGGRDATSVSGLSEYEVLELVQAAGNAGSIYRVTVCFNENNTMNTVGGVQVFAALKEIGKVLRSVPDFDSLLGDEFYPVIDYYVASRESTERIQAVCMITDVTLSADVLLLQASKTASAPRRQPAPARKSGKSRSAAEASPLEEESAQWRKAPESEEGTPEAPSPSVAQGAPSTPAAVEDAGAAAAEAAREQKAIKTMQGSVLRVDSRRIDDLLNLVSEAVISKASFNQISIQYAQSLLDLQGVNTQYRDKLKTLFEAMPEYLKEMTDGKPDTVIVRDLMQRFGSISGLVESFEKQLKTAVGRFRNSSQNLARIIGELQEAVMRIRMVPIAHVFSRFPRLVRDLSKSLGKTVELVIEGEETELDKSVIEDLIDPLIHCVRNSLDHGLESAEDRVDAGKTAAGRITLRARNEGNMIVIEVSDDGKGIDVEAVRKKAVERGLIHPSKKLTNTEAFSLIFEPGFTTARKVTSISGRGVGLDVVKRQVDKLNGSVEVHSDLGKQTTFTIRLPLTLAIIQGLLVRVGPETYAIPITSVIESVRLKTSEVKLIDTYEVFNLRDDVLSLLRLNRLFRIPVDENRSTYFIVIVGTQDKKVGLLVDSLIGEEDLVIKPLKGHYTASPGIAGATILGDGTVSLILDVGRLLEFSVQREQDERKQRTVVPAE
jgi:two-component system chemotaxis sensor kinase CheA